MQQNSQPAPAPTQQRKIGRHHIAFFRGILLGMDIGQMAEQYLETGMDLRRAKTTLVWVRDTLRQAALRHGKHRVAHLMRLRVALHPITETTTTPSLEDFRAAVDPDGFFTEKELFASYVEAHPQTVDSRAQKRQRLINRQLEALKWIEPLITADPVRADWVAAWFDEVIAKHLLLAGLPTIGHLIDHIATRGYRWWLTVPRLGEKGAVRISTWLQGYESTLGALPSQSIVPLRSIPVASLIQARPSCTDVVPLESFLVPPNLDGQTGSNRFPGAPRIDATNDLEAIHAWLKSKSGNPSTKRSYRKEAERLLLWAILERGKALSSLTVDDCADYRTWLSMIGHPEETNWPYRIPQEAWIGERGVGRHQPTWRPFDGALAEKSIKFAITLVSNLFEWLMRVQYCAFNPWIAVSKSATKPNPKDVPPDIEFNRAFTVGQWQHLMEYLASLPTTNRSARLRFVLPFAYTTGLRISELVDATVGRIYTMPLREGIGVRWMLKVFGKRGKWRAVPLASDVADALKLYFEHRGLSQDITSNPSDTPLIASESNSGAITTNPLATALRSLFKACAKALREAGLTDEAKAFDRATTHWLRHTCGSHMALSGQPLNVIQRLLGHESLQTTGIYTDTADENLWYAVEQVKQVRLPSITPVRP